ncbi:hypothetical protein VIGAN_01090200, partial [Vigna angularis var. angularis]
PQSTVHRQRIVHRTAAVHRSCVRHHSARRFHHFEAPFNAETTIDMSFKVSLCLFRYNLRLEALSLVKTTIEDEKT